jgi:hypothetical protein
MRKFQYDDPNIGVVDTIMPPFKNQVHNVLHIDISPFRETSLTARVMHHPRSFWVMTRSSGVQVQVWTRLGLLITMKIHNFFRIHLLLPYIVTEAYTTRHSRPPPVMTHSSRFGTISWRYVLLGMIVRSIVLSVLKRYVTRTPLPRILQALPMIMTSGFRSLTM